MPNIRNIMLKTLEDLPLSRFLFLSMSSMVRSSSSFLGSTFGSTGLVGSTFGSTVGSTGGPGGPGVGVGG